MIDREFARAVAGAADRFAVPLVARGAAEPHGIPHRELMRRVKILVAAYRSPDSALNGSEQALEAARRHLAALRALQTPSGLFAGGDNVQSPPDSAFTVNDVCDAFVLADGGRTGATADAGGGGGTDLGDLALMLAEIASAASGALLAGGVHTPNHRWELCAALARLHRSFPDGRYPQRIEQWLSEGIDIDDEGLYSERSPNYAAHVSNPSLLLLADVLGRPDLRAAVERNLVTTLDLIRPDGTVETVQSRRQDQNDRFPLAPYLYCYRLLANRGGRGDFGRAARLAAASGINDPRLLAQSILEPDLLKPLPDETIQALPRERYLATTRLVSRASAGIHAVAYGGSDVPALRRIRSGLANNPTFFRLFAGDAVLDAVRLSRGFFDLGPFRAQEMSRLAEGRYRLTETLSAGYYQPLPPEARSADGRYDIEDEGRFCAAMSFSNRSRDEVTLTTRVDVDLRDDGADLLIDIEGPKVPWALELTFRPPGQLRGAERMGDGRWCLPGGAATFQAGDDMIDVEVDLEAGDPLAGPEANGILTYDPGQDYTYPGGTDATTGERLYLGGHGPHTLRVSLRAIGRSLLLMTGSPFGHLSRQRRCASRAAATGGTPRACS